MKYILCAILNTLYDIVVSPLIKFIKLPFCTEFFACLLMIFMVSIAMFLPGGATAVAKYIIELDKEEDGKAKFYMVILIDLLSTVIFIASFKWYDIVSTILKFPSYHNIYEKISNLEVYVYFEAKIILFICLISLLYSVQKIIEIYNRNYKLCKEKAKG